MEAENNVSPTVKIDNLTVGGIYDIRSRNLLTGVWTGAGFIGIRLKFDSRYLFTEWPNLENRPGTVTLVGGRLGQVSEGIRLVESYRDGDTLVSNTALYNALEAFPHG